MTGLGDQLDFEMELSDKIEVKPIYGWGWFDSGRELLDVPETFIAIGKFVSNSEWSGRITSPDHKYFDAKLLLSKRHTNWDGLVNVQFEHSALGKITGYAEVKVNSCECSI